jgi:hypothetical protein
MFELFVSTLFRRRVADWEVEHRASVVTKVALCYRELLASNVIAETDLGSLSGFCFDISIPLRLLIDICLYYHMLCSF